MIKVMSIFGTRPEAIKMAPLVIELQKRKEIQSVVCSTGQHKEMLAQVLEIFQLEPDYDLNIMRPGQTLKDITTNILLNLEEVLKKEKPDIVLVHGDTSTAYSAALSAFYNQIPIGHVEAGLRTYNLKSPFPEEFNRQSIGLIADMHFAPTERAKEHLLKEGKDQNSIFVTGNTAIDALKYTVKDNYQNDLLKKLENKKMILLTAHRRENIGKPLKNICNAVKRIVEENEDIVVVYPIHLNPIVRETAKGILGDMDRVKFIEPLDAIGFHNFMSKAYLVLTDSGGIQEEAPSLGKPVIVLRDTTERPEGVEAGTLILAGTEENDIYNRTKELLTNVDLYEKMKTTSNPYGDGFASKRIVDEIIKRIRREV
ncbi:MAG: UDP-N-acetylglucosamine 2-epimerase (non-hydrolyzing) [Clostridia bacterium]|nr:UDP-N-acetylglucosamine 2-epimerase (non-hydrolyzing) [Clostridia bacterium]MDD4375930.1 UDP-N-acetylglucosamine 2-epimerase (non-hydrolyzing) [Clostridia bacterium]